MVVSPLRTVVFILLCGGLLVPAMAMAQETRLNVRDMGSAQTAEPTTQPQGSTEEAGDGGEAAAHGSYRVRIHQPRGAQPSVDRFLDQEHTQLYRGIIPMERDDLPHLGVARRSAERRSRNEVTWIGFQAEDERTRVFLQTAQTPRYRTEFGENTVVIVLENTGISIRNFERFIDTQYFGRNVQRIETERDGRDVRVTLTLLNAERPSIQASGDYLYMDFPEEGRQAAMARQESDVEQQQAGLMASAAEEDDFAPVPEREPAPLHEDEREEDPDFAALDPDEDRPPRQLIDEEAERERQERERKAANRVAMGRGFVIGGLVLAAGGGGLAAYSESQRRQVTSVPEDDVVPMTQQEAAALQDRTNRMDTIALVMVGAGAAAFVTGGVLWMSGARMRDSNVAVSVAPEGASFVFTRRF